MYFKYCKCISITHEHTGPSMYLNYKYKIPECILNIILNTCILNADNHCLLVSLRTG